jgi:hypothetical protein
MGNLYQFGRIREYDAHNTYGYMEAKWTSKALLNVWRCFVRPARCAALTLPADYRQATVRPEPFDVSRHGQIRSRFGARRSSRAHANVSFHRATLPRTGWVTTTPRGSPCVIPFPVRARAAGSRGVS